MLTLITFSEAYSELCQTSKMRNQIQRWLTQGNYFYKITTSQMFARFCIHICFPSYVISTSTVFSAFTASNTPISPHFLVLHRNFVESHSSRRVSAKSPITMRKLCVCTKFLHWEIKLNVGMLWSDQLYDILRFF